MALIHEFTLLLRLALLPSLENPADAGMHLLHLKDISKFKHWYESDTVLKRNKSFCSSEEVNYLSLSIASSLPVSEESCTGVVDVDPLIRLINHYPSYN